jgi:hypothetical protein
MGRKCKCTRIYDRNTFRGGRKKRKEKKRTGNRYIPGWLSRVLSALFLKEIMLK